MKAKPLGPVLSIILASIGVTLFINGGILLRTASGFFELSDFGWFFLPLAIYLLRNRETRSRLAKNIDLIEHFLSIRYVYATVAILQSLLFLVTHSMGVLNRYLSFRADWDLAIYANACANKLHSSLRGETTLLADHFEPFLFLFTPLCSSFDPAVILLVAQCLGLILGGLGVLTLTRALGLTRVTSLFLFFVYINFPGHMTTLRYDFHVLGLAMATIPWLVYAAFCKRWLLYALIALVHISLKENASLSIVAFGSFLLLKQRKSAGFCSVILGALCFILIMKVIFPYYRDGQESLYFAKYYDHLGKDMQSIALVMVEKPAHVLSQILTWQRFVYMFKLMLPFMFLPVLSPSTLLPVFPAIAINVLSKERYMFGGGFHYQAEIYPFLFCTTLWALNQGELNPLFLRAKIIAREMHCRPKSLMRLWLFFLLVFFSGKGLGWYAKFYEPTPYQTYLRAALLERLPDLKGRNVAAIEKVATHLARIPHLYLLDEAHRADTIVVAYPQSNNLWQFKQEKIEQTFIPALSKEWELSFQDPHFPDFRIWKKQDPE